jgi:hypothetical protein
MLDGLSGGCRLQYIKHTTDVVIDVVHRHSHSLNDFSMGLPELSVIL